MNAALSGSVRLTTYETAFYREGRIEPLRKGRCEMGYILLDNGRWRAVPDVDGVVKWCEYSEDPVLSKP